MPYALARDIAAWGSSSTGGNQDGTGVTYWTRLDALTDGPGVIKNKGLGGSSEATILAAVQAATTNEKAADTLLQFGGNNFNTAGDAEDHFAAYESALAAIGHPRFVAWISHNASTEAYGSGTWLRARKLHRYQWNRDPGKAVDLSYLYRYWPTNDKSDDTFPTALRFDTTHLNATGYNYGTDKCWLAWAEANNGGLPFIAPYARLYTNAASAHHNGGAVIQVPYVGDATGCTFSFGSAQTDFAISASGLITRASGTALTADYYELPITITRGPETRTTPVRLSVGSAATAPSRVELDGNAWFVNDLNFTGVGNTHTQLSIVVDLEFFDVATDGASQRILMTGSSGNGISIERLTSNQLRIYVRDAAVTGNSVVTISSGSGNLFRTTEGRRWAFFHVDTVAGVGRLIVDDNAVTVSVTPTPASANLSLAPANQGSRMFSSSDSGANICKLRTSCIWAGVGFIDFSVQANRDLFRNRVTKEGADLGPSGTVAGVTPFLYLRGTAGDYLHGKNAGTGGDFVAVDKGRYTTQTLAVQPEPVEEDTEITQHGITWTLEGSPQVGQYANGDYWVVGPVTITSISPPSATVDGWTKNGTQVNPAAGVSTQGFDSSIAGASQGGAYSNELNVDPGNTGAPLVVETGTVCKAISKGTPQASGGTSRPQLADMAYLTVAESAPEAGAFRPAPVGTDKASHWKESDLDYSFLRSITPLTGAPSVATAEASFARPWVEFCPESHARWIHPANNMPEYNRDSSSVIAGALWVLNSNYTNEEKRTLLVRMVQYGLDVYGSVSRGMTYPDNGGINPGRKLPLLVAGRALNDAAILAYGDAAQHFIFHEDRQTWLVTESDLARAHPAHDPGLFPGAGDDWTAIPHMPATDSDNRRRDAYEAGHVGMYEWGEKHATQPIRDGSNWDAFYRTINIHALIGHALLAHLMDLRTAWNWKPFFGYYRRAWGVQQPLPYGGSNQPQTADYHAWSLYQSEFDSATTPTGYTLTGPTSGRIGSARTFTISAVGGVFGGDEVFTPVNTGLTGTFSAATVTPVAGSSSVTFTFTGSAPSSGTIGVTDNQGWTDPAAIAFTVAAPSSSSGGSFRLRLGLGLGLGLGRGRGGGGSPAPIVIISDRNQFPNAVHAQTSGNKSATYRVRYELNGDGSKIRLTYANKYNPGTAEANVGGVITIKARVVYGGVNTPVTFSAGNSSLTLAQGEVGSSDWVEVDPTISVASFLFVDTFVDAGPAPADTTKLYPTNTFLYNALGEGRVLDIDRTGPEDVAPTLISATVSTGGFGPVLIQSRSSTRRKVVGIVGDSIATGQGDTSGDAGIRRHSQNEMGFIRRALDAAKIPYIRVSKPGETAEQYSASGAAVTREVLMSAARVTDVIYQLGVNDVTNATLAQMKARAQAVWSMQAAAGRRIYATTLTPRTSSTDWWLTTTNQSHVSPGQTGAAGVRTAYNDWIRAGADGLIDGYFEVADIVESARNSGVWASRSILATGTVSSATSTVLTVAGSPWSVGQWRNCVVEITGGTGFPQASSNLPRTIQDNTANTLTLIAGQAFSPALGADTTFRTWKPLTIDGTHPATEAATLMAAAINTGLFT